ncbi:site-2 protease family protein [Pseudarthrobacter sp. SL88]|uniref:site-2 protease family protein n=1 Tax=Pseudarthrobacter sp. SL88 TaxID=2994666 RepID=UPI002273ED0E|nr:site-2 protease family protein [Pseudarthrobacter sp. SL88]MCY1674756.1 site-2 protease family protein [Pseudarthrobacter sp. SL88]
MREPANPEPAAPGHREGIPLGRIAGVPVVLAYSWFIIAAFTVIVYGPVLQRNYPHLGTGAFIVAFGYSVLLLISVLVHELAHALSARVYGWPTQKIVLNLWGGHTQFESFTASPGRSVIVALAGPGVNFVLAGAGWLLLPYLPPDSAVGILNNIFMWANFLIGAFNVLPGLPLDGGRLVESAVWKATGSQAKGTVAAGWAGRIIVVALVAWFIFRPMLAGSDPDFMMVIITVLVCSFLWMGASASIQQGTLRARLPLVTAAGLSTPAIAVPATASVRDLLGYGAAAHKSMVVCGPDGRPQGVVDPAALASVPEAAAGSTPVTAVSFALAPGAYVPEWSKGQELIQFLAQVEGKHYAVVDHNGAVTGLLTQDAVLAAITGKNRRTRQA